MSKMAGGGESDLDEFYKVFEECLRLLKEAFISDH